MEISQFQKQLQEKVSVWLRYGNKSGFIEIESETVVLSSVLGKRSENQDRTIFLRVKFEETSKPSIAVLVLCDGMGGMDSGGDCADIAISAFVASFVFNNRNILSDKLKIAVNYANQTVYEKFQGRGGATLSAVACSDINEWAAVNVGDSRIYCVRNNGVIEQLTIDDTLEKQLADLNLPSPPPEFKQLLQYVGMGEGIEPRNVELRFLLNIRWFLITSDGAHYIPEDTLKSLISHAKSPKEIACRLTNLSEWLGGTDNSSVAILDVKKDRFSRNRESNISSLEIWSIPDKIEFLTLKPVQIDVPKTEILDSPKTRTTKTRDIPKQQDIAQPQKLSKRKTRSDIQKINSVNGYKPENGEENSEKPIPKLNIEFSEEN
ncbi:MAG: serine/threonine-protein phosphatase [Coleofasciculaceae cyanobacterium SM2_1_6]|nr:serine/threonine-protein phosphatase [Coleofasciculaceae cyanobacterium SM2_1_6]